MTDQHQHNMPLGELDPEVAQAIAGELGRQRDAIGLIRQPQVETLPRGVRVVDKADTEVGLDQVAWP